MLKLKNLEKHNRFGLVYEDKEGKQYLYKSYKTEEAISKAMKNDEDFKKIEKEKVYIFRLSDSDLEEKGDKDNIEKS